MAFAEIPARTTHGTGQGGVISLPTSTVSSPRLDSDWQSATMIVHGDGIEVSPRHGALSLPSVPTNDVKDPYAFDGRKPNPFDDPPPPPFSHSHHLSTASLTVNHTGATQTTAGHQGPVPYDADAEGIQAASERLAQALESAASREPNKRARSKLLKKARRIRRAHSATTTASAQPEGKEGEEGQFKGGMGALKAVGCGLALLVTTPVYLAGTIVEGTGVALKASGMIVKGFGYGMKKAHLVAVEKMKIKL